MLLTLLAFFYISFLCYIFGAWLLGYIQSINKNAFLTCFIGLTVLSAFVVLFSLFFPVGGIVPHLLLATASALLLLYKKVILPDKNAFSGFSPLAIALLSISILLILVMHSYTINHPDTLIYHAYTIQSGEESKAIQGIANIKYHYGIQSSWFLLCGLFSFNFITTDPLTFLNFTVVTWFVLFIVDKINTSLISKESDKTQGIYWLLFLAFSFWCYTQIRLTVTSGSPDFIVAIYTWLLVYMSMSNIENRSKKFSLLLLLLGLFSFTLKATAWLLIPYALFIVYLKFKEKKFTTVLIQTGILTILVLLPFITRNFITSGYPLFPTTVGDIISPEWKVPKESMYEWQEYIVDYARKQTGSNEEQVASTHKMSRLAWVPSWWRSNLLSYKLLITSCIVSLLITPFFLKRNKTIYTGTYLFALIGILTWFVTAPDPRFGFGFLSIPIFLLALLVKTKTNSIPLLKTSILLLTITLTAYTGFRLKNYFSPKQLISPLGIVKQK